MSQDHHPEGYEAVFQAIARAVRQLPEEERSRINAQLGEFTHDLKHLVGLVTGANSVVLRSAPSDESGEQIVEMVKISNHAAAEIDAFIEVIVQHLYLSTRPKLD